MKIGEEIKIKEDFKINTTISEKVITIKKGDKGYIDSNGFLHLLTGNGRGKIVKINDVKVKGYDHENITKLIFDRLNTEIRLEEILENEELNNKDLLEVIEDVLSDIL